VNREEESCLDQLSREWNFPLTQESILSILKFSRHLIEWNAHINLTGAKSASEVLGEHVVDSFAMAQVVPTGSSVVDIGAGSGFPGLPFAILRPDTQLTLVEPRAKRVAFLRMATRELGLENSKVLRARSSDLRDGKFDIAASRATFPPEEWLTIGLGVARCGGKVLIFANEPWHSETSPLNLSNAISYKTVGGRTRWLGAFCST
jgi:16S rRNA (guanine527-N7)-methyltransferase